MNDALSPILIVENRLTDLDLTKRAFAKQRIRNPILEARDGEAAVAYIERWEAGGVTSRLYPAGTTEDQWPRGFAQVREPCNKLKHSKYCFTTSSEDRTSPKRTGWAAIPSS
jgi:hypothetical protein